MGLRLAGERSTWGGEFGDWHLGTTLCKQEVRVMMILVAAVMMKSGSLPERLTWSRRSRGSWREGTAERKRSFKFVQKLGKHF